jgi:hypothetical protein
MFARVGRRERKKEKLSGKEVNGLSRWEEVYISIHPIKAHTGKSKERV